MSYNEIDLFRHVNYVGRVFRLYSNSHDAISKLSNSHAGSNTSSCTIVGEGGISGFKGGITAVKEASVVTKEASLVSKEASLLVRRYQW